MKANERAFHAWYAACVIQEFGLARVYREVHYLKDDLFDLVGRRPATERLHEGNELFPDLSVSWEPDIDARHSATRAERLRKAGRMLREFGILSELKVTGSTRSATPPRDVMSDLVKLGVFAGAHAATPPAGGCEGRGLATYMVILDNFCHGEGGARPHYDVERIAELIRGAKRDWPGEWPMPTILVIRPGAVDAEVVTYRQLEAR